MEVLHVIDASTPASMLEQLARIDGRIICLGPEPAWPPVGWRPERVEKVHWPAAGHMLSAAIRAKSFAPADVVHAWSPSAFPAAQALAGELGARHFAWTTTLKGRSEGDKLLRASVMRAGPWPEWIAPTPFDRGVMLAAGADAARVHVVPPAVGAPTLHRDAVREMLGLGRSQPLLVAPGDLELRCRLKEALWVHEVLRHIHPEAHLAVTGRGSYSGRIEYFANRAGCPERISFTGDRFRPVDVLAAADVALILGRSPEGCAASLAAGLPIVAARWSANVCMLDQAAHWVAAGEIKAASAAILDLIEDGSARREAAARSAAHARNTETKTQPAERLAAIYRRGPRWADTSSIDPAGHS